MGARGVEKTERQNQELKISHPPWNPTTCKKAIRKTSSKERIHKSQVRRRRRKRVTRKHQERQERRQEKRQEAPGGARRRQERRSARRRQEAPGGARKYKLYKLVQNGARCTRWYRLCKMGVYNISSMRIVARGEAR
jgi:hypothetical protein